MKHLPEIPETPLPKWDDASALSLGNGKALIINNDMLVWETDIPKSMTPSQAARKSVVMAVSDLGAKGVQPLAFMASLAVPRDYPVSDVEEIAMGFAEGVEEYGIPMIGGDTNEACDIIIDGMAFGIIEEAKLMKRHGARSGDVIATTGNFGETAAAFKILLEDYTSPVGIKDNLLDSILMPRARVREGIALANLGVVTSCMDSSDGLSLSLHDLQRNTGLGYKVSSIPISSEVKEFAREHGLNSVDLALFGGEEYELVFTLHPKHVKKAKSALIKIGSEMHVMGEVVSEPSIWLEIDGHSRDIPAQGWDHFTS
jgi:thiamine-monophosphate kinase